MTAAPTPVEVYESGDAALRVVAVSPDREQNWAAVHALAAWLETADVEGVYGAVPTYDSVLVEFDPYVTSARQIRAFVLLGMRQLDFVGAPARTPRQFEVPVVYGGDYGPDLQKVADHEGTPGFRDRRPAHRQVVRHPVPGGAGRITHDGWSGLSAACA